MRNILVAGPFTKEDLGGLAGSANLYWLKEMNQRELDDLLPSLDCIFVHFWPKEIDGEMLAKMTRLSFIQSALAGVNHIPFRDLPSSVTVSSNAGGYSDEVGEFAWGLLLSAAKRIVKLNIASRENWSKSPLELGRDVVVLKGRTLGVLGYGGIGRVVGRIGKAFGMKVMVLSRKDVMDEGLESLHGEDGLNTILRSCDALVLALPLTNSTRNMIAREEIDMMKKRAILVNVARAEIVDQQAIYEHLLRNKEFVYATDVWWMKDGKESYPSDLPFLGLENFIGTPHVSGPSAVAGPGPLNNALENLLKFIDGSTPENIVDRADYT
ncbi:MAG: 2-hydroxyacid dehydrogenase [Thaumarchaeota archaeon]|nr:2-hydroxyacid dehydrogenase [Nitrososphaerota archaeon]